VKLFCLSLALASLGIGAARAQDAQALLHRYRCDLCHADTAAKTGPSYAVIAAGYRGDAKAARKVAALIRSGAHGAGPWHMPPHPELSAAEASKMARYILSRKE
jgi:cytochrome c